MKKISLFLLVLVSMFMMTGCGGTMSKYNIEKDIAFTKLEENEKKTKEELVELQLENMKKYEKFSCESKVKRNKNFEDPQEKFSYTGNFNIEKLENDKCIYYKEETSKLKRSDGYWRKEFNSVYYADGASYMRCVKEKSDKENSEGKFKLVVEESYDEIAMSFISSLTLGFINIKDGDQGYDKDGNFIVEHLEKTEDNIFRVRLVFKDDLLIYFGMMIDTKDYRYDKNEIVYTYGKATIDVPKDLSEYETVK